MNEIQAEENPLSQDFDIKSLLKFAFPTIVMMLLMGLYTIVDTIFVARFAGTNALSALNIVCPVINLIVGLGTMLATGGSAIVARKMGAGETVRASQDFTLIIGAGVLLGAAITVLGAVFIDGIILGFGASQILFPYCREYLFILLLTTLYIGFSMGVAPIISYNYGKQDNGRLKKVFSVCMRFIILVSIVIFGMAIAFGSPLVSLFSEKGRTLMRLHEDVF